jgi:hypothetical protein
MPVKVPLAASVPADKVELLIVLLTVMFWFRMKPGNCPSVTVPIFGNVLVLFELRLKFVASAMSTGERKGSPRPLFALR